MNSQNKMSGHTNCKGFDIFSAWLDLKLWLTRHFSLKKWFLISLHHHDKLGHISNLVKITEE